jgi:hypothetical protein
LVGFDTPLRGMNVINVLLGKLSENSTWRGLILIATAVGLKLDPEQANAIIAAGLAVVGLVNVLRKG